MNRKHGTQGPNSFTSRSVDLRKCGFAARPKILLTVTRSHDLAIERSWLELHESGTFVSFTQRGRDLFA